MTNLVGVLRQNGKNGIVELDRKDENYGNSIHIPRNFLNGAPFDMKVVVEAKGTGANGEPYGSVVEVLGELGKPDVAILSIIKYYNLPLSFPDEVLEEAKQFPNSLTEKDIQEELKQGRVDLRKMQTITIDGEDAKDLDDAIDLEKLENGNYRLFVHIADVTHYIKEDSALDAEAFKRGNSVYLVDRVIPMYPHQLSNGLCSLNPNQDRFAFTAEMEINPQGLTVAGKLYSSVIHSKVRSSYREVQGILDGGEVDVDRPDWFKDKIFLMKELTDILQAMRTKRGALGFEFPETKVILDKEGHPVDIFPEDDLYANHVIEAFMIAANEYTGTLAKEKNIPIIYRVHELPDTDKLFAFKKLAKRFNIKVDISEKPEPIELAKALEQMQGKEFGQTLSSMLLRSLAKARYTEKSLGHFGLASQNYCHFTSPIRRYSDTVTHRNLKKWLEEGDVFTKKDFQHLHVVGDYISDTERKAIDAERDTVDQKAAEYYADKIGEIYEGKISGFSPASMFVQLENSVEGAVFFRTLDGFYEYDPEQLIAKNQKSGAILALGQSVTIQVAGVDLNRRFIDFSLVKHDTARTAKKKKGRRKSSRRKEQAKKEAQDFIKKQKQKNKSRSKAKTKAKKKLKNKKTTKGKRRK